VFEKVAAAADEVAVAAEMADDFAVKPVLSGDVDGSVVAAF